MRLGLPAVVFVLFLALLSGLKPVLGIRFIMHREECLSHDVKYIADKVQVSFVVIKYDSGWSDAQQGVDLVVKGSFGDQIIDFRDKISEKFEFVTREKGVHRFCFTNKSPHYETIDFDVHENHFTVFEEHAKDEHFNPLLEQISNLQYALNNIRFEQRWLEAETERQQIVTDAMSKRAVDKAFVESAALIGVSILQVYLLQRLFNRKIGMFRI
ncbi:hypothetical protein SLA2020_343910 [Shorea laevis]